MTTDHVRRLGHGTVVAAAVRVFADSVGVRLDWSVDRDGLRLTVDHRGGPAIAASGYARLIPGVPPRKNLAGVSFSVANTTGLQAAFWKPNPG